MSNPLLKTKLFTPPTRPQLLSRPHLLERLDAGPRAGRKLTLVSAPAGFGKTTLLSEWVHQKSDGAGGNDASPISNTQYPSFAWLSLDEEDSEVARFWTYLIAALGTVHTDLGQDALELLQAPQPPPAQAILTPLLNEIAGPPQDIVLILDDYHLISTPAIHEGVTFLLEHQPPNMHLVLSTRADPPLPTFRLRARGQLTELRSADLRFTPDEAATFLNRLMGLDLAREDVRALEARTEGWIVGLQLAALSLQGRTDARAFISAFTGGHHYVLEYLTEEVVRRQPEPVQRFLIQTSILEQLCGPLCDAILKEDGGVSASDHDPLALYHAESMLESLQRRNLFLVPLDDARRWYRYHHLFADLLRNLLRRDFPPEQILALHRRASRWYQENGKVHDAIKHALQAQEFERAAALIEREIKTTLSRGNVTTLLRWEEALPEEILGARPRLRMYQGWALFLNGQLPRANPMFQQAKAALQGMPPSPEKDALWGELFAMLATISVVLQDIPQAIEEAGEALGCLPSDDLISRARATRALGVAYGLGGDTDRAVQMCSAAKPLALAAGNHFLAAEIISQLASGQMHQGRLREATRSYQEIIALVEPPSRFPPAGLGYIGLADVSLEWNDLDAVEDLLNQGIELCQRGGIGYGLRPAYCTRAILRQALGDTEGALEAIRQAEQFDPAVPLLERAIHLAWHQVRLWLLLDDVETAYRWATGAGVIPNLSFEHLPIFLYELQQVALARVYLAQSEPEKVLAIADRLCAPAEAGGRMARVIELSLLEALALQAQGRLDAAHAPFARCLALAEPGGYVRLFLEAGPPVITLLREAATRGISPEYVEKLLGAFGVPQQEKALVPKPHVPGLIEPLTRRELEVLGLIGAGYSNRQIADRLVLALNTVKRHTSNIYGKLGVRSRAQAILRAQELGIL